jgi:hypothetical protein
LKSLQLGLVNIWKINCASVGEQRLLLIETNIGAVSTDVLQLILGKVAYSQFPWVLGDFTRPK